MIPEADLTEDRFLGGRLTIRQPRHGYRTGADAVLLAASVPARAGESVLELGCGVGAAILCLAVRVPGLALAAIEIEGDYAALARANAAAAGVALSVHDGDMTAPPPAIKALRVDHVLANPPYFDRAHGHGAADGARETGRGERAPLAAWVECAARRLRPGGWLTLIQRTERLPAVLAALAPRFGAIELLPLAARAGRAPETFILRARLGRRTPFRLLAPLILHPGDGHGADGGTFRPEVEKVLRNAAPLPCLSARSGD